MSLFFQLPVLSCNVSLMLPKSGNTSFPLGNKVVIILFWPTGVPLLTDHLLQLEEKGNILLMPSTHGDDLAGCLITESP